MNRPAGFLAPSSGYVYVNVNNQQRAFHRVIWEHHHGPVPRGFQLHHINGIRHDNRIENLELLSIREHAARHITDKPRGPHGYLASMG